MPARIGPTYFQCEVGPSGESFRGSTPESAGGLEDTEDSSLMEHGCAVGRGERVLTNIPVNMYLRRLKCIAYLQHSSLWADQEVKYIDNDHHSGSVGNLTFKNRASYI
jgi:hypothetical protein